MCQSWFISILLSFSFLIERCKLFISEPIFSFHFKRLRWIGKNSEGYRLLHKYPILERPCKSYKLKPVKRTTILEFFSLLFTLPWGTRGFLACGGNFRWWPKADTFSRRPVHYKDLTETGNCARIVSGTQGNPPSTLCRLKFPLS